MHKKIILGWAILSILFGCGGGGVEVKTQGWVSSGGSSVGTAMNAWWVKNTDFVRYCVQMEEEAISQPRDKVFRLVYFALEYWTTEFTRHITYVKDMAGYTPASNLGNGKQIFVPQPCNGTEDLTFHFGYETLSQVQRDYIATQPKGVAMAVRTAYDEVNLRGKGFIYIASDKGPHRYDGGPQAIESPWKYVPALYLVLVHELGHVFGLPHSDGFGLMSTQYPEVLTSKLMEKNYQGLGTGISMVRASATPPYFLPASHFDQCGITPAGKEFFKLTQEENCLGIHQIENTLNFILVASKTLQGELPSIGKLRDIQWRPTVEMSNLFFLPSAQTVFKPGSSDPYIAGPLILRLTGSAIYESLQGEAQPIMVTFNGDQPVDLWGLVQGRLESLMTGFYVSDSKGT